MAMSKKVAFDEVYSNPPKVVAQTRRKEGATQARKQMVAIALSKAGMSRKKHGPVKTVRVGKP